MCPVFQPYFLDFWDGSANDGTGTGNKTGNGSGNGRTSLGNPMSS